MNTADIFAWAIRKPDGTLSAWLHETEADAHERLSFGTWGDDCTVIRVRITTDLGGGAE